MMLRHGDGEPTKFIIADDVTSDEAIYRFYWDCGRMGFVDGLFCASKSEIADLMGTEIYLGEVLGKHSEVFGTIEPKDITLISDDVTLVAMFKQHKMSNGYNPLHYINDED